MTSAIETVGRVLRGGDPKRVPTWTQPMVLDPGKVVPLGTLGQRTFYDWVDQRLEVEEIGELLSPDSPAIAEGPHLKLMQPDGSYRLQALKAWPRGTFAAGLSVVGKSPAPPPAPAPVDALDAATLLSGMGGAGRFHFRGAPAILERLKAKGIEFRSLGEGVDAVVIVPGGRLSATIRDELDLVAPLITGYIATGSIPHCEGRHREPVPATTLALAVPSPVPWCGSAECMPS